MTIVKDNDSPPPYSAVPSIKSSGRPVEQQYPSSSSQPSSQPESVAGPFVPETSLPNDAFPPQQHTRTYGPTPIPQQLDQGALLPYYDPRSPYATQQAVSRARWRFFSAFLWAVGIYVALGIVTGGIVVDIRRS